MRRHGSARSSTRRHISPHTRIRRYPLVRIHTRPFDCGVVRSRTHESSSDTIAGRYQGTAPLSGSTVERNRRREARREGPHGVGAPISSRDAGVSGLCRTVPWNDRRRLKSGDAAETRRSLESDRTRDERVRKLILELLLRFAGSPSAPSIRQILLDVSVRTGLNLFSRSRRCKYAVRRCPRHPRGSRGSRRSRMGYIVLKPSLSSSYAHP